MNLSYLLTPAIAWVFAGSAKFVINSVRARRIAVDLVGYGGFPSSHTAIVSSIAFLIFFDHGPNNPVLGVAVSMVLVVVIDAAGLRRHIGKHARTINAIARTIPLFGHPDLRERMGHSVLEIFGGVIVGLTVAYLLRYR